MEQVERLIQEGDLDALSTFLRQLKSTTDFDQMYDIAGILAAYGFLQETDEIYELLLIHFPEEAQLKIDRATTLLELGEEDQALLLLQEIQPNDDAYAQALLVQADYYQMIGLAETAINKIKEAHDLYPQEPVIQFAYAELLLDAGRYAEATRFYLALKDQVDMIGEVKIVERLAEVYSAGAAYEEALPYYEVLLEDNQAPEILFGASFAYYQAGQAKQALPLLEELIAMDPDYYSAYMLIGQTYLQLEENKKAYDAFEAGIARDEYDKELRLSAGKCALKLGLPREAENHLAEALVLDPEYIEALVTLASLYNETEQDEALIELVTGTEQVEDLAMLHAFSAYAYERMESYKDAYDSFKKAYDGMKDDYSFLSSFASFLIEEGRREEAVDVAIELVGQFPEDQNWNAFLETEKNGEV